MTAATTPPWPAEHLRAVGRTFRGAGGRGLSQPACMKAAEEAYLAAGGDAPDPRATVTEMIDLLSREHPEWLYGPTLDWLERQLAPVRADEFEMPEIA